MLQYSEARQSLGLDDVPNRTTRSRRYKALYLVVQDFIAFIGQYAEVLDPQFDSRDLYTDKSLFKEGPVVPVRPQSRAEAGETAPSGYGNVDFFTGLVNPYPKNSPSVHIRCVREEREQVMLGEALDAPELVWTTFGDAPWVGQTQHSFADGDAAQTSSMNDWESGHVETAVAGPGALSFYWRVPSEANFDYLRFFVNDQEQFAISGMVDWEARTEHFLKASTCCAGSTKRTPRCPEMMMPHG